MTPSIITRALEALECQPQDGAFTVPDATIRRNVKRELRRALAQYHQVPGEEPAQYDFTHHDIPAPVRELLGRAHDHLQFTTSETYALALTYGTDWRALTNYLCECAFANRHTPGIHAIIVRAAEEVWKAIPETKTPC